MGRDCTSINRHPAIKGPSCYGRYSIPQIVINGIAWMHECMGLDRLRALGHHRGKGLLLIEPMGKQMPPHTRQTGYDLDDLCARGHRPMACSVTRAALATIEPPGDPPPIDMA